jgi:hypothetical protein
MEENSYPTLLQALMSESDGDSNAAVQALLAQADSADPRLLLLTTLLSRRQPAEAKWTTEEVPEDPYGWERHKPLSAMGFSGEGASSLNEHQGSRLLEKRRLLRGELEELREWNEALASALGACARCWGEDPSCPGCQGSGSPGANVPNRPLFTAFVVPAVRRVQAAQLKEKAQRREEVPQHSTIGTMPDLAKPDVGGELESDEPSETIEGSKDD